MRSFLFETCQIKNILKRKIIKQFFLKNIKYVFKKTDIFVF